MTREQLKSVDEIIRDLFARGGPQQPRRARREIAPEIIPTAEIMRPSSSKCLEREHRRLRRTWGQD